MYKKKSLRLLKETMFHGLYSEKISERAALSASSDLEADGYKL